MLLSALSNEDEDEWTTIDEDDDVESCLLILLSFAVLFTPPSNEASEGAAKMPVEDFWSLVGILYKYYARINTLLGNFYRTINFHDLLNRIF